jgi:hypothetical protein
VRQFDCIRAAAHATSIVSTQHECLVCCAEGQAQAWQLRLEQCVVLMDDLQSGLLRPDACSAGVLPAASLSNLRGLFFTELQTRVCGLALMAVKGATADCHSGHHTQHNQQQQGVSAASARNLVLGLDLLGKVLPTVSSAGTLPVSSLSLTVHCSCPTYLDACLYSSYHAVTDVEGQSCPRAHR